MPPRGKITEITIEEACSGCKTRKCRTNILPLEASPGAVNISAEDALIEFDADDEDSDFESRKGHLVLGKFSPRVFMLVITHERLFEILYSARETHSYVEDEGFLCLLIDIRGRFGKFLDKIPENHRLMLIQVVRVVIKVLKREATKR